MSSAVAVAETKNPHIVNPRTLSVPESTTSTLSVASARCEAHQVLKFLVAEALNPVSKKWYEFGYAMMPRAEAAIEQIESSGNEDVPRCLKVFLEWIETGPNITFEKFFSAVDSVSEDHNHLFLLNRKETLAEIKNNQQWPFVSNESELSTQFLNDHVIQHLTENWEVIGYLLLAEEKHRVKTIKRDNNSNEERLSAVFETAKELNKPITYSTLKNLFNCKSINKGDLLNKIQFPVDCLPTVPKQKDVQKVTTKQPNASTESEASTTQCSSSTAHTHSQQAQSEVSSQQNIQELQIQLDEMKRQLLESQAKNKSSDSKNVELQSQLERIKNQQQETSDEMKALSSENVTLQTENRTLKNQYDKALKSKAGSMGDTLQNALDRCRKIEAEKKELQERIDALNAELRKASQPAPPKVPEYIRKSMTKQQQDIEKLKQEQVDNQEKIASLNKDNEKFKVDSFTQQIKAKKLQRELDAKTKENQELTRNVETLLTDVFKSKNNNAELKSEIEKLNDEVKALKHSNNQAAKDRSVHSQYDAISKSPALVSTPNTLSSLSDRHKRYTAGISECLVSLTKVCHTFGATSTMKLDTVHKAKQEKESKLAKLQEEVLRQLETIQKLTLEYDSDVVIRQNLVDEIEKRASERALENLELSDKLDDERALVNALNGLNNDLEKELKQVREKLFEKEAMLIQLKP